MKTLPWVIRTLDPSRDFGGLQTLDTSFRIDRVYRVRLRSDGFEIALEAVPSRLKTLPIDDLRGSRWHDAWVAESAGRVVGVVATHGESWNRRLVLDHLYVDAGMRRRGVGRALMEHALRHGRAQGARTAWLETQNVNVPAVSACRAMGFALCGCDLSLYRGTPADGEVALFMAMDLGG